MFKWCCIKTTTLPYSAPYSTLKDGQDFNQSWIHFKYTEYRFTSIENVRTLKMKIYFLKTVQDKPICFGQNNTGFIWLYRAGSLRIKYEWVLLCRFINATCSSNHNSTSPVQSEVQCLPSYKM